MYHAYLKPKHDQPGMCRGGLEDEETYVLEIDYRANCKPEVLAIAAHTPELMEFLHDSASPVAALIWRSIRRVTEELKKTSTE